MLKVAVLVSGSGSNLQSIFDEIDKGSLDISIEYVISDKEGAFAIERAKVRGIKAFVLKRNEGELSDRILKIIEDKVDLIVLAGYLSILKGEIVKKFKDKIINIHPSLIPSFCGNGMYGLKVHKAAVDYGVKVSGCTVHFVDEGTDSGPIILQRTVPVFSTDTPESLQKRILIEEHRALPDALRLISEGRVKIEGRRVFIEENI